MGLREQGRAEDLHGVPTAFFGPVHGGVGTFDECFEIGAIVGIQTDPDAGGDKDLLLRDDHRRRERPSKPLAHEGRSLDPGDVGQKHRELVAAESGDRVLVADTRL